ncbi:heme exporter protein CcmD [Alteromonas aestuariivivens]|uniref:Heme exporter protein D n=1 Tax=Alteromonas aestuariivivens TaxID=1938339 RepID=A0A3D8M5D6_9ALTE|nr:heme exporter protein CcmD [Alteromonas aestuariivivens]RDV24362.1 heme exporter protein CcmD [Alteromonas aestuariivivens]
MQFDSWQAFLSMGGYALYVWLSFGVTFIAMLAIAWGSARQHTQLMQQVLKERARRARIRQARQNEPVQTAGLDAK